MAHFLLGMIKKSQGSIILFLFFLFIFAFPINATEFSNQKSNTITVAYTSTASFIEKRDDGSMYGYGVELLNEIAEITGWKYEYILETMDVCLQKIEDGSVDLLGLVQRTPEREQNMLFSTRIAGHEHTFAYTRPDNNEIFYNDSEELNGLTIGMIADSYQTRIFDRFVDLNNIEYTPKYFHTQEALDKALINHETDMNIGEFTSRDIPWKLIRDFGSDPFYFVIPKSKKSILTQFDDALTSILREKPEFIATLTAKYFEKDSQVLPRYTRAESLYIKNRAPVRVMIKSNAYPLEYIDKLTNQFSGVYADYFKRLQELTGLQFEYVPILNFEALQESIYTYNIDLICAIPSDTQQQLENKLRYTNPISTESIEIIGKKHTETLSSSSLGATSKAVISLEDAVYASILKEKFPNWKLSFEDSIPDALNAVAYNNYNVACCNIVYLQSLYDLNDFSDLTIYAGLGKRIPVSIGITDTHDIIVLSILNKAIASISEIEMDTFRTQNTVQVTKKTSVRRVIRSSIPIVIILTCFFIIIAFFVLHRREKRFKKLATEDRLTGIWNDQKFEEEVKKLLEKNKRQSFALFTIDINKFKFINQSYGPIPADNVLKQMAKKLKSLSKTTIYVARSFADRFYLLIEIYSKDDAIEYAKKIAAFNFEITGASSREFNLTIKQGIIIIAPDFHKDSDDVKTLIGKANIARHTIKGSINRSYAFYDDALNMIVTAETKIEDKMEEALSKGQFLIYFQPKFDLKTEKISGAEALIRWNDPTKGMISPDTFIPIFERNGFIIELDFFVYEQVFKFMRNWIDEGKELVIISVNMSRIHVGTPDFVEHFSTLAKKYNIPPSLIEIEVTESIFGDEDINVKNIILNLKKCGFRIAMDDFGSGYSSLNLLKEAPVDVLKIDRIFLAEATNSVRATIIIEKVVEMAHKIAIETVCEGVENRTQADFLNSIGCNKVQGYFFAHPMPPNEFEKILPSKL